MSKFSIITPVYNGGKYLEQCIKSVLEQSFQDFEMILINDGSSDNSLEIIEKYAKLDSRIKYFSKINEGQGTARNLALEKAKGDYVLYLDCDDWLVCDALLKLDEKFQKDNSDIVFFNVYKFYQYNNNKNEYRYIDFYSRFRENPFSPLDAKDILFNTNGLPFKAYKKNFLIDNNIKYSNTRFIEDSEFYFKAMLSASLISCLDEYILNYRIHKNSTTFKDENKISAIKKVFYICEKVLNESKYKDIKEIKENFLKNRVEQLLYYFSFIDKKYKKDYFIMTKNILKFIKEKYGFDFLNKNPLYYQCMDIIQYPYGIYEIKRFIKLHLIFLKSYIEI